MTKRNTYYFTLVLVVFASSCSKTNTSKQEAVATPAASTSKIANKISGATFLGAPIAEEKVYKLIPGYDHTTDFEASGLQYLSGYLYVVLDNMQKVAKLKSTLPVNDSHNSLLSTGTPGSGSSNFEGITLDNHSTNNFYIVEESAQNGSNYQPRIYEYDGSVNYQNRMWAEYYFSSANSNKAFEGIAWVYRGGENYLLGLVESTGKVVVLRKTSSKWAYVTEITLPSSVTFNDYSDIALYGDKVAITSQEDGQVWIGTLSSTSWAITGGTAYSFPLGDSNGTIGAGSLQIYGNVEGVTFVSATQIAICSDKAKSDQPSYQTYKEMTVSVFNLP